MKIEGWNIDGYGTFHEARVDDLRGGVTVFLGQNEAGKSTLLAFLRGMLFGFPDRRSRENRYPPLAGGRHGGTLTLSHNGALWTLTRYAEKGKPFMLRGPDGRAADGSDLRRLLGGVDDTLFKSVYAFSLDELQRFATLDAQSVRERIFSVGITGAGVSARAALTSLAGDEAALLKQKMGQSRINDLVRGIQTLEIDARQAAGAAAKYPALLAEEQTWAGSIGELEARLGALAVSRQRLETLSRLRPDLEESDRLRATLASLRQPSSVDEPDEVSRLIRELLILRSREESLADLRESRGIAEADLERHLHHLGVGWTIDRISTVDDSLQTRDAIRGWRQTHTIAQNDVVAAERDERDSRENCARLADDHQRCTGELPETPPPAAEFLSRRESALRALRSQIRDLQMAELQDAMRRESTRAPGWRAPAAAATGLLVAAAIAAATGRLQLTAGLAAGGAILLAVALVQGFRSRPGHNDGVSGSPDALARLRDEVAEGSRELGLLARPSESDLNSLDAELDEMRGRRIVCDGSEAQVREIEAKLEAAQRQLTRATAETMSARTRATAEEEAWREWLTARDLPAVSPEGLLEVLDEVRQARRAIESLTRAVSGISQVERQRTEWDQDASAVLAVGLPVDRALSSVELETGIAERGQSLEWRRAALERLAEFEERLATGLATLDGEAARAELAEGDMSVWREEIERIEGEVKDTSQLRTRAIEARRDAQRAREALEQSADVPRLQSELENLRAELSLAAHDYRVVRASSGLVQATLEGYVRDRQPGVLERASAAFADATGGRFRAVLQDAGADADTVVVEQWDGARLTPDQLSRGTAEQLYLAIRLALVEEYAARGHELPLIMDDCLVNFDPGRAAAMARLIAESAAGGQCLFFTCHPAIAELLEADAEHPARVVLLPGRLTPAAHC